MLVDELKLFAGVVHEKRFFADLVEVLVKAVSVELVEQQKGVHCPLDVLALSFSNPELWRNDFARCGKHAHLVLLIFQLFVVALRNALQFTNLMELLRNGEGLRDFRIRHMNIKKSHRLRKKVVRH